MALAWTEVVVRGAAVVLAAWVLVPVIMHALGLMGLRADIDAEPARAEPMAGDPDYERRFQQFAQLGFRPIGVSRETGWFITPFDWRWRSLGCSWMQSADDRTLVSFHRLIPEEPVRFGAFTLFEGDAMVRTVCPGAGIEHENQEGRRVEMRNVDPATLLAAHDNHVDAFGRDRGITATTATLAALIAVDVEQDRRLLLERRHRSGGNGLAMWFFGLPTVAAFALLARSGGSFWHHLAVATCVGGGLFVLMRTVVLKAAHRQSVLRSHTEDVSQKPKQ